MISNIVHKSAIIKCPHCWAEYLPGEIYMPNSIIGQPDEVVKDSLGKIIYEDYYTVDREPNLTESFTCEYCNKHDNGIVGGAQTMRPCTGCRGRKQGGFFVCFSLSVYISVAALCPF